MLTKEKAIATAKANAKKNPEQVKQLGKKKPTVDPYPKYTKKK